MSSRFQLDQGSAVIEFVLVLVPTTLLIFPLISLVSLMHEGLATQQVAYDVARYGSLADTTSAMKIGYRNSRDSELDLTVRTDQASCITQVSVTKTYENYLWPLALAIESRASVQCEKF